MRRQTAVGEAFAGSSPNLRLDPFALPVRYTVPLAGRAPGAATVHLDRDRTIVRRVLLGGTPLTVTLPLSAYRGVAVRMEPADEGDIRVIVELLHRDPALSLPLVIADDPADIAADWQAWGRALRLPLLLMEADGSVTEPVRRMGKVEITLPRPRRRHSYFAARRPRFLVRRKPGRPGPRETVRGDEIIARR